MFGKHVVKLSLLLAFGTLFWVAQATAQGQYGGDQPKPAQDQSASQQTPDQKQGQVDAQTITAALRQDPSLGKVTVHADAKAITLSGTVTDKDARDKAQQIAEQNAGGRKINNKIKINSNVHPGPGL